MTQPTLPFLAIVPKRVNSALREADRDRMEWLGEALGEAGFSFACEEAESPGELVKAIKSHRPRLAYCSFFRFGSGPDAANAQDVLSREAVPFIGSTSGILELTSSKSRLKRVWESRGIETPSSFRVSRTRTGSIAGLKLTGTARDYPYIVKPEGEDENRGIHARSIAFDADALRASVESALEEYDELIIEHFLASPDSREITVAMIGNGEGALVMPAEIRLKEPRPIRVITKEDREGNQTVALPVVATVEGARIGAFAKRAFECARVLDYARCDIIEDRGRLYALEVNGQPRLPDPWFEACANGVGLMPGQCIAAIALAALHRYRFAGHPGCEIPAALREALPSPLLDKLLG